MLYWTDVVDNIKRVNMSVAGKRMMIEAVQWRKAFYRIDQEFR
jgi:hypothetical protein